MAKHEIPMVPIFTHSFFDGLLMGSELVREVR